MPHSTHKQQRQLYPLDEDNSSELSEESKIGNVIARKRLEKNMTQGNLAKYINVSDQTITNWECERVSMSWLKRAHMLCMALQTNLSDLFPDPNVEPLKEIELNLIEKLINEIKSGTRKLNLGKKEKDLRQRIYETDTHPGLRIKERRDSLGMSQRELAELLEVSDGTVAGWELRTVSMKWLERAHLLCEALDLDLEEVYPNTKLAIRAKHNNREREQKLRQEFMVIEKEQLRQARNSR